MIIHSMTIYGSILVFYKHYLKYLYHLTYYKHIINYLKIHHSMTDRLR